MPKTQLAGDAALVVRRTISAPPAAVFEAFTQPALMQQWMGPDEVECVACETELRVGGRYRIHLRSRAGDHVATGQYLEIVPNERLVFSWSWESGVVRDTRVTVTLHPRGERTEVELLHEKLPEQDAVEKHTRGWSECLKNLAALY